MSVFLFNENFGVAIFSSFFSLNCILFEKLFSLFSLMNSLRVDLIFFNHHKQFAVISGEKVGLNKSSCVTLHQKTK